MNRSSRTQPIRLLRQRVSILALAVAALLVPSGTAAAGSGTTSLCIRITGWPSAVGQAPVAASVSGSAIAEASLIAEAERAQGAILRTEAARQATEPVAFVAASHSVVAPSAALVRNGDAAIEVSGLSARTVAAIGSYGPVGVGLSGTVRVPAGTAAGDYEGDVLVLLSWE